MTRYDFITSDEYITATTECVIVSGRPIGKMRGEVNDFVIGLRKELLEYAQSLLSEKWISVLPGSYKDETLYLLWGDDWSNPQIGSFWTNRNDHGWHDYIGDPLYRVTHYQPLPSPPTK